LSRRIRSATGIAAAVLTATAAWGSLLASPAGAATAGEIRSCPSYGSLGMARCTVQGGAIIDGSYMTGSGSGALAQERWTGKGTAAAPGTLTLTYMLSDQTAGDAVSTMTLDVKQPGCKALPRSTASSTSAPDNEWETLTVTVACAGKYSYTITRRLETTSPTGHFTSDLLALSLDLAAG
jgi:hypothetical protein